MRRIDPRKVATMRRVVPVVATTPAPEGYVLVFLPEAFNARIHRNGCACQLARAEAPTMLQGASYASVQIDPFVQRLRARGWSILPSGCIGSG